MAKTLKFEEIKIVFSRRLQLCLYIFKVWKKHGLFIIKHLMPQSQHTQHRRGTILISTATAVSPIYCCCYMELRNVADFIYKSFTRCGEKMEIHCWSITIKLTLQQSDYVTETLRGRWYGDVK